MEQRRKNVNYTMYDEPHKLEDYLDRKLKCSCGHEHVNTD